MKKGLDDELGHRNVDVRTFTHHFPSPVEKKASFQARGSRVSKMRSLPRFESRPMAFLRILVDDPASQMTPINRL